MCRRYRGGAITLDKNHITLKRSGKVVTTGTVSSTTTNGYVSVLTDPLIAPTDVDVTIAVPGYKQKTFTAKTESTVTAANKDMKLWPDTIAGELARLQDTKEMLNSVIANRFGETVDSSLTIDDYAKIIDPTQNYMVPVYFDFTSISFSVMMGYTTPTYVYSTADDLASSIRAWGFESNYNVEFNYITNGNTYNSYAYSYNLYIDRRCTTLTWWPYKNISGTYTIKKPETYTFTVLLNIYDASHTLLKSYSSDAYDASNNIITMDFKHTGNISYFKFSSIAVPDTAAYLTVTCNHNFD